MEALSKRVSVNTVLVQSTFTGAFSNTTVVVTPTAAPTRSHVMERNFKVFLLHVMHAYGALEVWLHSFLTGSICGCDQLHSPALTRARKKHPPPNSGAHLTLKALN
jgi:hypothetical protein